MVSCAAAAGAARFAIEKVGDRRIVDGDLPAVLKGPSEAAAWIGKSGRGASRHIAPTPEAD